MIRITTALLAALAAPAGWPGTSQFSVRLTVSGEKCTSETVSATAEAVVQVICSSGPFVTIEPANPRPRAAALAPTVSGASGGAFRYVIGSPEAALAGFVPLATTDGTTAYPPEGTVTGFRVVGDSVADNHFELLISF